MQPAIGPQPQATLPVEGARPRRILHWLWLALVATSILFAAGAAGALASGRIPWVMPMLSGAALCFALGAAGHATTRKWSFLIWLCASVLLGMTFPERFTGIGDFKFTTIFIPILQVIMFCMGTTLSIGDFARVFRRPGACWVGIACQFTIMPALGCALARLSGFPPEIGAGLILVGSVPSGLASTVMSYIAKADVALSVTLTAMTSLLSPIITPLLMKWLAGEMVEISAPKLMWDLTKMTVIPVLAGLAWHHGMRNRAQWLSRIMPYFSIAGIVIMCLLTIAVGRDNLLRLGVILIVICFAHSTAGYCLGYLVCRCLRMNQNTCRTIAFEVGMQNAGMASAIAASLQKVGTLGLAPIVFGPVMNMTASTLANWWRTRPVKDSSE